MSEPIRASDHPDWARACPASYGRFLKAILVCGDQLAALGVRHRDLGGVLGRLAAEAWACGQESIEESRRNGADVFRRQRSN